MAVELTDGAISKISSGEMRAPDVKPVLQVIEVLPVLIHTVGTCSLFPLTLSDGVLHQRAMFVSERKPEGLKGGSIVQLKEYDPLPFPLSIVIRIRKLDVLHESCKAIGDTRRCTFRPRAAPMQPIIHPTTTVNEIRVDPKKRLFEELDEIVDSDIKKLRRKITEVAHSKWKPTTGSNLTWNMDGEMTKRYPQIFGKLLIQETESSEGEVM